MCKVTIATIWAQHDENWIKIDQVMARRKPAPKVAFDLEMTFDLQMTSTWSEPWSQKWLFGLKLTLTFDFYRSHVYCTVLQYPQFKPNMNQIGWKLTKLWQDETFKGPNDLDLCPFEVTCSYKMCSVPIPTSNDWMKLSKVQMTLTFEGHR